MSALVATNSRVRIRGRVAFRTARGSPPGPGPGSDPWSGDVQIYFARNAVARWLAVRLDALAACFISLVAMFAVRGHTTLARAATPRLPKVDDALVRMRR
jgi:hypothetical protein